MMKSRIFAGCLAVAGCLITAAPCVLAASAASTRASVLPARPAAFIAGTWIMGFYKIEISANRALGPAERIIVTLPERLQKSGDATFSLTRKEGNVWVGANGATTLTFKLESDNFGVLSMNEGMPNHHFDLPVSRF